MQDRFHPLGLRAGADFHLGYSPERIDPGNALWDFQRTPKVVSGIDELSADAVASFYEHLVDTVVRVKGTKEAELTKLLEVMSERGFYGCFVYST